MSPTKSRRPNLLSKLHSRVLLGLGVKQRATDITDEAHRIQMRLLPNQTPQLPGFQIACAWQPSKDASADYFDVLPLGEGKLGLCIADVSGKGTPAALLMSNLQASLKTFAAADVSPSALCSQLNAVLSDNIAPGRYVSLFYALLDGSARTIRYESAGHCLPLLVRADGSIQILEASSGVLGLFSHWTYNDQDLLLASGDVLVMMTDGLLEAADRKGDEFGYKRLIATVLSVRGDGAHLVRQRVMEEVTHFCGDEFADDASLIVLAVE
ncbi:MAG TPA: PP2C family protein-serine/threonine phosphatase [Acidobacteriaceae bacterium]|nr:PP2C family protein-serine/threonine phosphatase [Acidobacteriaceae bacterium]